jgi:CheY-like chemotaxis protein
MPHDQDTSRSEEQPKVKTILVVEDDEGTAEVLALALAEERAYHVLVVPTASEAVQAATTMQVDLFVFDYLLAGMTGVALYDQLHALPELQEVPALLISASLQQHTQELQSRHLIGLSKPFDLDELLQTIEQVLSMGEQRACP